MKVRIPIEGARWHLQRFQSEWGVDHVMWEVIRSDGKQFCSEELSIEQLLLVDADPKLLGYEDETEAGE